MFPRVIAEGRYVVLDCETTGVNRNKDEIVQIAFGHVDRGIIGLRGFYTIRPYRTIAPGASFKHGLTYEKLAYSRSFNDVAGELRALIGDRTVVGFNAKSFDVPILKRQFGETGIEFEPKIVDVLVWSRKLVPGGKHDLVTMTARLDVPMLAAHDAWNDCRMTWSVFGQLALRYAALGDVGPDEAAGIKSSSETNACSAA